MSRSLKVDYHCIDQVKLALRRNGYPHQRALAYDTGLSLATVSNFLTGKPVDYATFEELCRKLNLNWREITTTSDEVISTHPPYVQIRKKKHHLQDWGTAVDITAFYGRREELSQLQSWILQDSCRLVALFGMGGVGKTTLATQLAKQIQDEFDYVFWRSVSTMSSFDSMITVMLSFISNDQETKPDINLLIHYLRTRRCLIILDNLKVALNADYTEYGEFIRIIGETQHRSCLIVTSRDKPIEVSLLEKWSLSLRSLMLLGSSEVAFSLLQTKQLLGTEQQKYELCHLYSNNPLKIKIIVNTIIDLFEGDIEQFLEQNTLLVSHHLNQLLEQQLNCLSHLEQQIIYSLAINKQLTTIINLAKNRLPTVSISHILQAIERLYSCCLIEKKAGKYTLAPVVREYVTNQLKQQSALELVNNKIAM